MAEHNGSEIVMGGSILAIRSASKTRPANTTAYASGDVIAESTTVATVITFSEMVRQPGGSGVIGRVDIIDSAYVATTLICELWLFDTTVTADQDNAVFTPTDAELATLVAIIPVSAAYVGDATSGVGGNAILSSGVVNTPFKCASGSTTLYGVLVARNAYVPISGEIFTVRTFIYQD